MKYKIGQLVQICSHLNGDYNYISLEFPGTSLYCNSKMLKYCNDIFKVVHIYEADNRFPERYELCDLFYRGDTNISLWVWSSEMILPASDNSIKKYLYEKRRAVILNEI